MGVKEARLEEQFYTQASKTWASHFGTVNISLIKGSFTVDIDIEVSLGA